MFNGKHMISIREYYEKGGEVLPGKKVGVSIYLFVFYGAVLTVQGWAIYGDGGFLQMLIDALQ